MKRVIEPRIEQEDIELVVKTLREGQFSGRSPICSQFEEEFADYVGVKHAIAVNSGTSALFLALKGLGIEGEVIVPNYAFIAVPNSVRHAGSEVKLVDVEEGTWNLDPTLIRPTEKTKAIIAVHTYGHPCDIDRIKEAGLPIIEDASEALGAEYKGKRVGGLTEISTFSFFANKTIMTGEGGMVCTNNDDLAKEIRLLKDQYRSGQYVHDKVGYGMSLSAIQCALGLSQLRRIDYILERKRELAEKYMKEYEVEVKDYAKHSWWIFAAKGHLHFPDTEFRPEFKPINQQKPYLDNTPYPVCDNIKLTCLPMSI